MCSICNICVKIIWSIVVVYMVHECNAECAIFLPSMRKSLFYCFLLSCFVCDLCMCVWLKCCVICFVVELMLIVDLEIYLLLVNEDLLCIWRCVALVMSCVLLFLGICIFCNGCCIILLLLYAFRDTIVVFI